MIELIITAKNKQGEVVGEKTYEQWPTTWEEAVELDGETKAFKYLNDARTIAHRQHLYKRTAADRVKVDTVLADLKVELEKGNITEDVYNFMADKYKK